MLLDQGSSWRQRGRPQSVDQAQDVGEQASRDCDFGKLERDIATMPDDLGADLDQLFPQCGERTVFDLLRQRQCLLWVTSGHSTPQQIESAGSQ